MSVRNIIVIDEEKCDGCELCVDACAEGAIQIIDGKAKLVSDILCDGFGACLGSCPQEALIIEQRDVEDYDEEAVEKHLEQIDKNKKMFEEKQKEKQQTEIKQVAHSSHSCPGAAMRALTPSQTDADLSQLPLQSQLGHWPVQLMLVPPHAPFLKDADLLICADCVPFTVPDFHSRYLAGRAVLVGCPKLDDLQFYHEKLKDIFREAQPKKVTVLKMEVPCCNGIAQAAIMALKEVSPGIPSEVHTIGIRGGIQVEDIKEARTAS